ncbi:MAG: hypothetical protein ACI8RZ_005294 [Myxococcota bacterium]|jgi:hypothetical protein
MKNRFLFATLAFASSACDTPTTPPAQPEVVTEVAAEEPEDCIANSCVIATTAITPHTAPDTNASVDRLDGPPVTMSMHNIPEEAFVEGEPINEEILAATCDTEPSSMELTYQLDQECFGWIRTASPQTAGMLIPGETTRDNSAACFHCFEDSLCFREYTGTLYCDEPNGSEGYVATKSTDKLFTTEGCVQDGGGQAATHLIGGTEDCPPWPEKYERSNEGCRQLLAEKGGCGNAMIVSTQGGGGGEAQQ